MPVRVERHCRNAAAVADALADHAQVETVYYPGRADHPQHELASRQMAGGGTIVAFNVKGTKADAFRFMNALEIVKISNNLGDSKSLITHPATTTHQRLEESERAELGITETTVRLSVGLENASDLISDLTNALNGR